MSYCRTVASYYGHGLSSDYLQISILLTGEAYARLKQGEFFSFFFLRKAEMAKIMFFNFVVKYLSFSGKYVFWMDCHLQSILYIFVKLFSVSAEIAV